MKKSLIALLPLLLAGSALFAQQDEEKRNVIKIQPLQFQDSIVYRRETAIMSIDRAELEAYMKSLDTVLKQRKYSAKVYQNVQFSKLTDAEVQRHYEQAMAYLNSNTDPLVFDVNNFVYFWAEGPGLLQPYMDEILPQLLQQGKVHMTEKYVKGAVSRYLFADHDINGKNYRVYRFLDNKEILKEQDIYTEPVINTTRK